MKKFMAALVCAVMLVAMFMPAMADEGENFLGEIGQIPCPNATPTIDGSIDAAEGWSAAQYIDKTNTDGAWGGEEVVITGNIYRAYDAEYLYIAADINIPEYSLCEGVDDWIEANVETGNKPGWDGDVFVFSIDPMMSLVENGMANEPAPWYCFGLFEGNALKTYRTHVNDGEITDIIPAAGSTTATGWKFEAAIPWETICKDLDDISYGDVVLTPEDVVKEGNVMSSAMIYYDRVFDPEAGERITGSRYVTICTTCPDGLPGTTATPWLSKAYGMFLVLEAPIGEDTAEDTTDEIPDTTDTDPVDTTADTTAQDTAESTGAVTDDTSSKETSDNSDGTISADTKETDKVTEEADKDTANKEDGDKDTDEKAEDATEDATETIFVDVTDDKGNVVTDDKGNKVTQKETQKVTQKDTQKNTAGKGTTAKTTTGKTTTGKSTTKKPTTGTSTGGNAAQTFDIGIAVALGALAVSGVGIVSSRKKR